MIKKGMLRVRRSAFLLGMVIVMLAQALDIATSAAASQNKKDPRVTELADLIERTYRAEPGYRTLPKETLLQMTVENAIQLREKLSSARPTSADGLDRFPDNFSANERELNAAAFMAIPALIGLGVDVARGDAFLRYGDHWGMTLGALWVIPGFFLTVTLLPPRLAWYVVYSPANAVRAIRYAYAHLAGKFRSTKNLRAIRRELSEELAKRNIPAAVSDNFCSQLLSEKPLVRVEIEELSVEDVGQTTASAQRNQGKL